MPKIRSRKSRVWPECAISEECGLCSFGDSDVRDFGLGWTLKKKKDVKSLSKGSKTKIILVTVCPESESTGNKWVKQRAHVGMWVVFRWQCKLKPQ